jgi:hypothetical protein
MSRNSLAAESSLPGVRLILIIGALFFCPPLMDRAAAQQPVGTGVILGAVTDTTLRPIDGADASIVLTGIRVTANTDGRFRITTIPAGKYLLAIRRIGYRAIAMPISVEANDTLRLAFTLEPLVSELGAVRITEVNRSQKLLEFDKRRQTGMGKFFTEAEIRKINPLSVADVFRRVPSVRVLDFAQSSRQSSMCPMAIYIDGMPVQSSRGETVPVRLVDLPPPTEFAGIEVYAGAATVPGWLSNPPRPHRIGCGAILLWTKDGSQDPPG